MKKKLIAAIFVSMMVILPYSVVEVMAQVTSETRVTPVEAFTVSGNSITGYDANVGGLDVVIPSMIEGVEITSIGNNAFSRKQIETVELSNSIKIVGDDAFSENYLTKIDLGENVEAIGTRAFQVSYAGSESIHLDEIVIPNSVREIKAYAFDGYDLDKLDLGEGVQKIGNHAFGGKSNTWSDTTLKTLNIPNSLVEIGKNVFVYNNFAYINLKPTNPLSNYGTSRIKGKNIVFEGRVKFNIKDLYPEIDTKSVSIKSIKSPTAAATYSYNVDTGDIVLDNMPFGNVINMFHSITVNDVDVLNVFTQFDVLFEFKTIFKEIDGTILKEETLVSKKGNAVYATPPEAPTGYHYEWDRDPKKMLTEALTEFTSGTIANDYVLEYDANSGIGTMDKQNFVYDVSQNLNDNKFTKEGYTFKSWNTKADGSGVNYTNLENVSNLAPSGTTKLYAIWTEALDTKYKVEHLLENLEDDNYTLFETENLTGTTNATITAVPKSYTGFTPEATVTGVIAADGSLVLQIKYTRDRFDVSFNSDEAQTTPETIIGVKYDSLISEPASLTKPGYTFKGWYTDAEFTNKWDFATNKVKTNTTLYASWSQNFYEVNFAANGGTGTMEQAIVNQGDSLVIPTSKFVRENYTFISWNTKEDGTGTNYAVGDILNPELTRELQGTMTLYAQWSINYYNLTFDKNTGEGDMSSIVVNQGDSIVIPNSTFTKEGYTFKNWNTKADGTGVKYNPGDTFDTNTLTKILQGDIVLFAKWDANKYVIQFNNNLGEGQMEDQEFTYDLGSSLNPNSFINTGYKFTGWNTKADGTGLAYTDGQEVENILTSGTVVLYAQWVLVATEIEPSVPTVPQVPLEPTTEIETVKPELEDTGVTTNIFIYIITMVVATSLYTIRRRN